MTVRATASARFSHSRGMQFRVSINGLTDAIDLSALWVGVGRMTGTSPPADSSGFEATLDTPWYGLEGGSYTSPGEHPSSVQCNNADAAVGGFLTAGKYVWLYAQDNRDAPNMLATVGPFLIRP